VGSFSDRWYPSLAVRQMEYLRMMMGNSRGKFELSRWRIIAADLGNTSYNSWEIPNWGFPLRDIPLTSSARIPMRKAYLPMHGNAWPNSGTLPLRQIFICEPILLKLGHVTRVDPGGHP